MKQLIKNYSFNTSTKAITLTDFTTIALQQVLLVVDVTTGKILYNPIDGTGGPGSVATNVLTLTALQGGENNTDKLEIWYEVQSGDPQAVLYASTPIIPGVTLSTLSGWTNATALNATQTIFSNSGAAAVLVQLDQTTTITAGAATFEVTFDGTNWVTIPANCVVDPTSSSYAQLSLPYTLQASTNKPFLILNNGWQGLRVKLSTQITGTGTVTPYYALLPFNPVLSVSLDSVTISENVAQFGGNNVVTGVGASGSGIPRVTVSNDSTIGLVAGSAIVGKFGIDQTTLGTTNNVSLSTSTGAGTSALIKDDPSFGDGVTTGIASVSSRLYNGTNYDRWRGDATNGAWVNIKNSVTLNAAQSGNWTSRIVGNGGAILDSAVGGATAPTNALAVAGTFLTTPYSLTNGQAGALQIDGVGNLKVVVNSPVLNSTAPSTGQFIAISDHSGLLQGVQSVLDYVGQLGTKIMGMGPLGQFSTGAYAPTAAQFEPLQIDQSGNLRTFPGMTPSTGLSTWNSATALNTTQTIFSWSGAPAVLVELNQGNTLTAGAITFEASYDGTNWVTVPANCVLDPTSTTYAQISLPYTLQASTLKYFIISNNGWSNLRIKLSTAITGTGSITPSYALLPFDPLPTTIALSPTAANFQVTANAGTNLNTSALALETGGNLATTATNTTGLNNAVGTAGSAIPTKGLIVQGSDGTNARALVTDTSGNLFTVGSIASGSADSGNPVKVGGKYNSTLPTFSNGQRGDFQLTSRGYLMVALGNPADNETANYLADNTDNVGQNSGSVFMTVLDRQTAFNGSTQWDRWRNNVNTTTGDTGTKTTTFNGATQTNYNARGAVVTILLGTVSGTSPTLAPQLQWSPDGGTTWLNLGPAMTNLTASNQTGAFMVYPTNISQAAGATPANLTNGATQSVMLNTPLPRTWRVTYTIGGTTPSFAVSSVQVNYIL